MRVLVRECAPDLIKRTVRLAATKESAMTELGHTSVQFIPESLKAFSGRMMDIDTHEMTPAEVWVREFGEDARDIAETFMKVPKFSPEVDSSIPDFTGDNVEITPETVWRMKGCRAPGSTDLARRLEIMDRIGVKRQLMFPSGVAIYGSWLANWPPEYGFLRDFTGDRQAWAYRLWNAHNEYCIRAARISERIRVVGVLFGDTPQDIVAMARRLIDNGVRAFWIFSSRLPGGVSPAHKDLDAMWELMTAHECTPTLHVGSDGNFLKTDEWSRATAFEGYKLGTEFNLSPWHTSTNHLAAQNFLGTCVVGGVFERHPALRFGVIELGAYWVGQLADNLDLWHRNNSTFGSVNAVRLGQTPSFYINRNVRVTPFYFEPVDMYFQRYENLQDVFCFSSDYPHLEGGRESMRTFAATLEKQGPAIMEKFFVTNGAYLLPD